MKRLELLEIVTHGLEELILFRSTDVGARLIDNLEPGSSNDLFIKNLSLGWRSSVRHPRDANEQVVANF